MITQQTTTAQIPQHARNEFGPNANSQRARRLCNQKLRELATATDPMWRGVLATTYRAQLIVGHKHGLDGSLLTEAQKCQQ